MNKLTELREAIIKAVPGILDLKRDCVYERKATKGRWISHMLNNDSSFEHICGCTRGKLTTQAFTSFHCGLCKKSLSWHNGGSPKWCIPCAKERGVCPHCKQGIRVLGRKICLSDVIYALARVKSDIWGIDCGGEFFSQNMSDGSPIYHNVKWEFLKDDLSLQSEDIINFLYDILIAK